jgi:alpha-1,2-mannosyltransferase
VTAIPTTALDTAPDTAPAGRYRPSMALLVGVCLISVAIQAAVGLHLYRQSPPAFLDLDVYRKGVQAWWHGRDMYGTLPRTIAHIRLPFIYPPFAVLVLGPLALVPWPVAAVTMMMVSMGGLAVVIFLTVRSLWPSADVRTVILVTAILVPLSLTLQPVQDTLWFGQVNLLLMAGVALDCLAPRTRWPRGLLIGIAAAVKLTPAVFILYFLLRKDYRAACTATISGVAATAVGFLVSWSGSVRFWFGAAGGARSVSGSKYFANQSIDGFVGRLGLSRSAHTLLWLAGVSVILIIAVFAIRRAHALGNAPLAMSATACLGLLASPTSWGHHWVYVVPGVIAIIAHRSPGWTVAAICTAMTWYLVPFLLVPHDGTKYLRWNWLQQIPGNGYTVTGIGLLVALAAPALRTRQRVQST